MYRSVAITAATSCAWYITFSVGRTICVSDMRVGIQCRLYLASVSPVITASTPGIFNALLASIDLIFACARSEEHTSELQSRLHLVCRLLLEKKKKTQRNDVPTHQLIP